MIKKVKYTDELSPFHRTAFGCRILATAEAYGVEEPFAQFWIQEGGGAAILKLDDVVVLNAGEADFDELKDFIHMTGAERMLCDVNAAEKIGFPVAGRGQVMAYDNTVPAQPRAVFEINPSLREIHALLSLCEEEKFPVPEFEPFYMDMSHRIRHDTAVTVGIRQGENLVSCAICSARTEENAVLSAVAVHPEYRRKGIGHETLSALISKLPKKKIYLLRAQNENENFYRSFGFADCGEFTELTV